MKKLYLYGCMMLALAIGGAALVPTGAALAADCGDYKTAILPCETDDGVGGVWGLLLLVVNILTGGVFIAAIGGIIYASVLYTSAGGNQEQVKKARTMITNVVIGIVAFALMFALLQWLVPGGVFNGNGDIETTTTPSSSTNNTTNTQNPPSGGGGSARPV